jgi:hypothetical protein
MKTKLLTTFFFFMVLFTSTNANAALIVGNTYLDSDGKQWEYVGSWVLSDGPQWSSAPGAGVMFTGISAAEFIFGPAAAGMIYATASVDTGLVDRLAWYDGWGWSEAFALSENFDVDNNDNDAYDNNGAQSPWGPGITDASAYISDHGFDNVNYAFVGTDIQSVSSPTTLAVLLMGVFGISLCLRRNKQ